MCFVITVVFFRVIHDIVVGADIDVRFDDIVLLTVYEGGLGAGEPGADALRDLHQLLGLDLGVGQQVGLAAGPLGEAHLADGALVTVGLAVQDLVHRQGAALAEPLVALHALVRLVLAVDVLVVPQVVLPPERLPTCLLYTSPSPRDS